MLPTIFNLYGQSGARTPYFRLSKQAALTTAPGPQPGLITITCDKATFEQNEYQSFTGKPAYHKNVNFTSNTHFALILTIWGFEHQLMSQRCVLYLLMSTKPSSPKHCGPRQVSMTVMLILEHCYCFLLIQFSLRVLKICRKLISFIRSFIPSSPLQLYSFFKNKYIRVH